MKYNVLVISKTDPNAWWMNTILERGDFSVRFVRNPARGLKEVTRTPCDLFILEDWPHDPALPRLLESVRHDIHTLAVAGLVITSAQDTAFQGEPIQGVLTAPFTAEALNDAIARTLGLPTRVQHRYLMRMMVGRGRRPSRGVEGVITVNINSGGMLVESLKPLTVGKRYVWHFSGPEAIDGLRLPGRVLRHMARGRTGIRHYIVQFDTRAKDERQRLGHYLMEHC